MNINDKEIRKLKAYYKNFNFKSFMKYGFSKNELLKLKEAFDFIDIEGKGAIDIGQFKKSLNDLGILSKNVDIKNMEENGIKEIDFNKFIELFGALPACKNEEEGKKLFSIFLGDYDFNKKLTADDLKRVADELGLDYADDEMDEMIRAIGTESPDGITFEEFYKVMTKMNM